MTDLFDKPSGVDDRYGGSAMGRPSGVSGGAQETPTQMPQVTLEPGWLEREGTAAREALARRKVPRFDLDAQIAALGADSLLPPEKPRKRKDQREHRLSYHLNHFLQRVVTEPAWYSAVDHSGPVGQKGDSPEQLAIKRMRWQQRQEAMGIKPDCPDWPAILQFDPVTFRPSAVCWIELKRDNNQPTRGQRTTMRLLQERGQVAEPAWTIYDCLAILRRAGFRLHGNADNIAREVQEKVAAGDRAAPAKLAAKAKRGAGKPRAAKPSAGRIKRVNAIRAKVMF